MLKINFLAVDLRLFDGEGGAEGATAPAQTAPVPPTRANKRGKSGEFDNVVFGKAPQGEITEAQTDPAAEGTQDVKTETKVTSDTLEARRKAYNDLIRGEYADFFREDTQRIIDKRFRETKNLEKRVSDVQPLIDLLSSRYNIADGDIGKLSQAIDADASYWEQAAEEAGMNVEQYKEFIKLQRENKAFRDAQREEEAKRAQTEARTKAEGWYQEAQAVKEKFPKFDFAAEIENPRFMALLNAGTPVEHAYKMIHMDELTADAVNAASIETERKVVDNIRAKGARPTENGASSQSGFTYKTDVHKLTRAERAEVAARAKRGEKIEW
jgi:hypothetical protein